MLTTNAKSMHHVIEFRWDYMSCWRNRKNVRKDVLKNYEIDTLSGKVKSRNTVYKMPKFSEIILLIINRLMVDTFAKV